MQYIYNENESLVCFVENLLLMFSDMEKKHLYTLNTVTIYYQYQLCICRNRKKRQSILCFDFILIM